MLDHLLILTAVMLVSGVLGGLVNYYQMLFTEEDPAGLARCLIMGLCGALMVPIFLKFTQSDLLIEIQGDPSRLLIFTGYCLLAAIASRMFVFNAARRQLRDASIARARVENLEQELRAMQLEMMPLLEHEIEGDPEQGPTLDFNQIRKLDENALHVLKLLNDGDCVFRSLSGMVQEGAWRPTPPPAPSTACWCWRWWARSTATWVSAGISPTRAARWCIAAAPRRPMAAS
ncbi:YEATS-associated helix-containing protein [Microbulbifer taiwanensis]|uniref:YEATS-associated helix-containing protein n=1 Tax=Microbulbifer taiwanensis TaxID=986746 RepID=UPI00361892E1